MSGNTKYCKNCGAEMKLSAKICTNCGAMNKVDPVKVIKGYLGKIADTGKAKVIKNSSGKGFFKKNNLVKMAIAIIAVFLLGSLFTKKESKSEIVENLENAIIDNNIPKLEKMIESSDKRLVVDEKVINILLSYYQENPSKLSTDMNNLLQGNDKYTPYRLEKRKGIFNEKYVLVLQSRFINVNGKADNLVIKVKHGDDVIEIVDKYSEIGPLSPGAYTIEATLRNDYVTREESKTVDLFSTLYESENSIELFNNVNNIKVKSNKPEAILYINGNSTEKRIKDIKNIVGLEKDTKIYAVIKEEDKTLKSNVLEVENDGTYELYFEEIVEENMDDIIALFIQNYEDGYENAVNEGDFGLVSEYLLEGSDVYYEYEENIELFYDKYIKRYLKSYSIENIDKLENDTYKVVVLESLIIDRNGEKTPTQIKLIATIKFIDGELYITEVIEK